MRQDSSFQTASDDSQKRTRLQKKSMGSYYTPEYLSFLITQDAIFRWISKRVGATIDTLDMLVKIKPRRRQELLTDLRTIRIVDPAVGEGSFLLAAANLLRHIRISLGEEEEELRRSIAAECLFGVDLERRAIEVCTDNIKNWVKMESSSLHELNIRHGNSLLGYLSLPEELHNASEAQLNKILYANLGQNNNTGSIDTLTEIKPFHWVLEYSNVFQNPAAGFDIVLGNPPYGSILGPLERRFIEKEYLINVGGGRTGTWNSAAHFLVRSVSMMKESGQLGFLVPNSILRVRQFAKVRDYLLNQTVLWKITDEGSPFTDVTLEMVSLFCELAWSEEGYEVQVESRRRGLEQSNTLSSNDFSDSGVFSIYHDPIFAIIKQRGSRGLLKAGRGRDIPKEHVKKEQTSEYSTPYITSGRSVRRYSLVEKHIYYADNWYMQDDALQNSFENEFLVATKNYRYPRCILKPKGMIHGGGIVKITPLYENAHLKALGLILNSTLIRQISIRYLTNYSQLTCCLNTGIMEEIPLVLPKYPEIYGSLFDSLTTLHSQKDSAPEEGIIGKLERLADALVYSLYFGDDKLEQYVSTERVGIEELAHDSEVVQHIKDILSIPFVRQLEQLGAFPESRKSLRY